MVSVICLILVISVISYFGFGHCLSFSSCTKFVEGTA